MSIDPPPPWPSESEGPDDPRLTAWLDVVDYYWLRADVGVEVRERLRADLLHDLVAARAEGATVEDLVAADPREFAADLAAADGAESRPLRPDPVLTTSGLAKVLLVGAVVGFAIALVVVYPAGYWVVDHVARTLAEQGYLAYGTHVVAAVVAVVTAVAAARWRFRFQLRDRRSLVEMGVLLAVGGALSIAPTIALARSTGYSGASEVVALEVLLVVGCCALGARVAAARACAPRRRPQP